MALTAQVKDELARVKITRTSARKAEVSSIFRFSSALHLVNGSIVLEAELDTAQAAKRLRADQGALRTVRGHRRHQRRGTAPLQPLPAAGDPRRRGAGPPDRPRRQPRPPGARTALGDRQRLGRRRRSRVAGAFLSHGSLTEPGRSSALEVTCPGPEAALASSAPPADWD